MNLIKFEKTFNKRFTKIEQNPWPLLRLVMLKDLEKFTESSIEPLQSKSYHVEISYALYEGFNTVYKLGTTLTLDPDILLWAYKTITDWKDNSVLKWVENELYTLLARLGNEIKVEQFLQIAGLTQEDFTGLERTDTARSSPNEIRGLFVLKSENSSIGTIADISLEKLAVSEKQTIDQIRISTHLVDEHDILSQQTNAVCTWLRRGKKSKGKFRLEYALDQPSSLLVGSSIGFALSILGKMGILAYKRNRSFEARIYRDVVVTGAIDEHGNVLPVSESTLKDKIEVAFYSDAKIVVLPIVHKTLANSILAKLNESYPNRKLEMVFESTVDELLAKRHIIYYQRRKVASRLFQFIHDYANSVTLMVLGFIVLIAAGFWFGVVKNPVPESVGYDVTTGITTIKNKFGFKLWNSLTNSKETIITDLENDGQKEIIIGYGYGKLNELSGKLVCYNYIGQIIWAYQSGYEVEYGSNKYSDYFRVIEVKVDDLNRDGLLEIVSTSTAGGSFPCRVFTLDYNGKLISEYWHSGQVHIGAIEEVYDGNHSKEIILTGINNEYRSGMLAIIDPYNVKGYSPQTKPYYQMKNRAKGSEIYYVKYPLTHYRKHPHYDRTKLLSVNEVGEIKIALEYSITTKSDGSVSICIIYEFDNALNLKMVDVCDNYYTYFSEYFPDKEPLELNDPELLNYFRQIDYWDGKKWTKERMVNERYLESLKQPSMLPQ